jgi:hypothetical protein
MMMKVIRALIKLARSESWHHPPKLRKQILAMITSLTTKTTTSKYFAWRVISYPTFT